MDMKILFPKFIPKSRFIDFPESNHQPVDKPFITPTLSYVFNSVNYPAEGALYGIGGYWNPTFPFKPILKNQKRVVREVLNVGSGLGVLFRIKSLNQFIESSFDLFDKLYHKLFIWRQNFFQDLFVQREKQDVLHKPMERFLFLFFRSVLVKEDGKVSLSMPDTPLRPHALREKIILNPRASVREKNFQFLIIQSLLQRFSKESPIFIYPKPHRLKPFFYTFIGQGPPALTHLLCY